MENVIRTTHRSTRTIHGCVAKIREDSAATMRIYPINIISYAKNPKEK